MADNEDPITDYSEIRAFKFAVCLPILTHVTTELSTLIYIKITFDAAKSKFYAILKFYLALTILC